MTGFRLSLTLIMLGAAITLGIVIDPLLAIGHVLLIAGTSLLAVKLDKHPDKRYTYCTREEIVHCQQLKQFTNRE